MEEGCSLNSINTVFYVVPVDKASLFLFYKQCLLVESFRIVTEEIGRKCILSLTDTICGPNCKPRWFIQKSILWKEGKATHSVFWRVKEG